MLCLAVKGGADIEGRCSPRLAGAKVLTRCYRMLLVAMPSPLPPPLGHWYGRDLGSLRGLAVGDAAPLGCAWLPLLAAGGGCLPQRRRALHGPGARLRQ